MSKSPSQIARQVLQTEAQALNRLGAELPDGFDITIHRLLQVPGRVIVTGMGKSGHVAAKIAATLASTGTPAQAVHPGEASHGDLGMITRNDAVIALSNSGETRELSDIIAHCARFDITLIAMTRKAGSTLARAADYLLLMPDAPEACAIGMAPTTSTTLAMAMGDALAVALMEARGFDRTSFLTFHPGGTLGAQLLRVGALMHSGTAVPVVAPDTPMEEALDEMGAKGFGVVAVAQEGVLQGILTDGDLRRNMGNLMGRTAGDLATRDPRTVPPDMLMTEALGLMNTHKITVLCVTEQGLLKGIVHIHDALRAGVA